MIATGQNGWPVLQHGSDKLHTWVIPARTGTFKIRLRNGSAGFLLAHFALWFAETIEPVAGRILDDWGHAVRPVRGQMTGYSNHAPGTAEDLNATEHPLGKVATFTAKQYRAIRSRLRWMRGVIRWGADYNGRKDEMHFEIVQSIAACEKEARRLMRTPRGRRLLEANPGQKAVILS